MRILIDINHPADVHQFKFFITDMKKRGHKFLIVARNKDVTFKLLEAYGIDYLPRKGYKGIFGKTIGLLKINSFLYKLSKKFKPDLLIGSSGDCYVAQISKLLKKPSIIFEDTEHSKIQNVLTFPFANKICVPSCFILNLGKKEVRYNSLKELSYLHPNNFSPNPKVLNKMGLKKNEKFFLIRFVEWSASHDIGKKNQFDKLKFIEDVKKEGKIIISSEGKLPKNLEKYKKDISPEDIHSLLYYAHMYIGEGGTMAAEAAVLGTPAVYINQLEMGYTNELRDKYGLIIQFDDFESNYEKIMKIIREKNIKNKLKKNVKDMLKEKDDPNAWMIKFIENFGGKE
ncbi:DUF354 domain-containing protein [archaeon]|nr:DUF354 domain-containing protein [archaeon]